MNAASTARCSTIPMTSEPRRPGLAALLLAALLLPAAAVGAAPPPACPDPAAGTLSGLTVRGRGDGDCTDPVTVVGARSAGQAAAVRKAWLKACRPGARVDEKGVVQRDGRVYEVVQLRRASGAAPERVCFDITASFSRW